MRLESSKTSSHNKGHLSRAGNPFLLVVSPEPGAELHERCDSVASGGWQGHVGLQDFLQER